MDKYIDFAALGQVLLVSLLAGAGLVAVYALGLLALARSEAPSAASEGAPGGVAGRDPVGLVAAVVCFAVVVAGIVLGLWVIIKS